MGTTAWTRLELVLLSTVTLMNEIRPGFSYSEPSGSRTRTTSASWPRSSSARRRFNSCRCVTGKSTRMVLSRTTVVSTPLSGPTMLPGVSAARPTRP